MGDAFVRLQALMYFVATYGDHTATVADWWVPL